MSDAPNAAQYWTAALSIGKQSYVEGSRFVLRRMVQRFAGATSKGNEDGASKSSIPSLIGAGNVVRPHGRVMLPGAVLGYGARGFA